MARFTKVRRAACIGELVALFGAIFTLVATALLLLKRGTRMAVPSRAAAAQVSTELLQGSGRYRERRRMRMNRLKAITVLALFFSGLTSVGNILMGAGTWIGSENQVAAQADTDQRTAVEFCENRINELEPTVYDPSASSPSTLVEACLKAKLPYLDGVHKAELQQYVYADKLINTGSSILDLVGDDLSGVVARNVDLHDVDLDGAILIRADLRGADLQGAALDGAKLNGADLSGVDLSHASLQGADFGVPTDHRGTGCGSDSNCKPSAYGPASLVGADLSNANLRHASADSSTFGQAKSLKGATLPDGTVHP